MDTKRINQLPVADALTENTNVLIEADGSTQRIPADKIVPIDGADGQVLTYQDGKAVWVDVLSGLPTTVPVIQSASVGQTVVVKAVDENGKPTEWEAADVSGGVLWVTLPSSFSEEGGVVYSGFRTTDKRLTASELNAAFASGPVRTCYSHGDGYYGTLIGYNINGKTAEAIVGTGSTTTIQSERWLLA